MNDACSGCLARKSIAMPQLASVSNCSWDAYQAPEGCWLLICYIREQERDMAMYFHKCIHASILVPPITHLDAWWPRSRIVQLNIEWMHMKTKQNLDSIMDNPECRWLGNWDTFRHSEYETYLVSRARANSYPKHNAICMTCMNATKIQPSIHTAMRWHTQCPR